MWFYFKCPECEKPISTYDTQDSDYVAPKILDGVKEHYTNEHGLDKLLLSDEELLYDIKTEKQSSAEEPTW